MHFIVYLLLIILPKVRAGPGSSITVVAKASCETNHRDLWNILSRTLLFAVNILLLVVV